MTAAQALPWLVTGLLAGSLADRRGARTLLAQADIARVVVLGVLVVAVAMGWASLPLVLLASFLLGVGETVRDTAAHVDRLVAGRRHRAIITWSLATTAGIPAVLAVTSQLWAAVLVIVVTSGSFAILNVTVVSLRQRLAPGELLGRVVAAGRTLSFSAAAAGALLGGALTATIKIEATFIFSGVVAAVASIAWWVASRP